MIILTERDPDYAPMVDTFIRMIGEWTGDNLSEIVSQTRVTLYDLESGTIWRGPDRMAPVDQNPSPPWMSVYSYAIMDSMINVSLSPIDVERIRIAAKTRCEERAHEIEQKLKLAENARVEAQYEVDKRLLAAIRECYSRHTESDVNVEQAAEPALG